MKVSEILGPNQSRVQRIGNPDAVVNLDGLFGVEPSESEEIETISPKGMGNAKPRRVPVDRTAAGDLLPGRRTHY